MSLWSPVDLVNGSRNVKNNNSLTNGNSRNYEQILEHLNAKLFSPNLTQDEKQALCAHLQNSFAKNRMLNPSNDALEGNVSDNQQQTSRNRNSNDNQRNNSQRNNQQQQLRNMAGKSSNQRQQQLNLSQQQQQQQSSKRSNNFNEQSFMEQLMSQNVIKKQKTNHPQQQSSQNNPQFQLLQAQVQMQFAQLQQQQQQQQIQRLQEMQKQQVLKQQLAKHAAQQAANSKKNNNDFSKQLLNQAALAALATGGEMPLDLCVNKKTASANDLIALANQIRQKNFMASLTNNDLASQIDNEQLAELMKQQQQQQQKRGRKPKQTQSSELSLIQPSSSSSVSFNQQTPNTSSSNFDLLNSLNNSARDSPVHQQNSSSLIDKQPRKRGRPPSTSTVTSATAGLSANQQQQQQQLNNQQLQNNQSSNANSNLGALQILNLLQNPEAANSPGAKAMLLQLLAALSQNQNNQNNRQNNNNSNNGLSQQELLLAQLQLANQLKNAQNQLQNRSQQSSNNRHQTSSTATSLSNNNLSTGKVVIEEIKTRDNMDSDESDSESGKDQGTFAKNYDERILRLPIACDWRRQTLIKSINKAGIRGEVFYITPCNKKLKNYSEVDKYLSKSNKNNLRKDHFNFTTRPIIGEFIEQQSDRQNDFRTLSENEVIQRIESIRRSFNKKPASASSANSSSNNSIIKTTNNQQSNNKRPTNNSAISAEQQQIEQEKRERLLAEAKLKEENKKRMIEMQKELELKRKKEQELKQELDRERRKQHQILVRILESNRRVMDREKKLTSFSNEKRLQTDRRNLKKRIETEIQKEIKKPVEDMMLKDLENLQTLNRIPGLKLSSKAFADLLMVYEFLYNFYECINLDKDNIPTLNSLQSALLNLDEDAENELMEILQHLLKIAIDDPGIPYNPATLIGQKLKDITINNLNITEVLKLYFQSYVSQIREDAVLDRIEFKLYNILDTGKPYLSFNATTKIEILAYICNELLCNQAIIKKIEDRIENASNVKRDKWVIENDLRKYKLLKAKREKQLEEELQQQEEAKAKAADATATTTTATKVKDEIDSDSDHDSQVYGNEIDGEDQLTNAEIDKNIEKLTKSVNNQSNKLNKIINSYRVTSFGQDRYRRRYWSLPNAGAVFVESMESCEIEENIKLLLEEENEEDEEEDEEEEENEKMEVEEEKPVVKKEEKVEKIKKEEEKNDKKVKKEESDDKKDGEKEDNKEENEVKAEEVEVKNEENEDGEEKSEMPNYLDLLNSEWVQQIINNVYLNYPQSKPAGGITKDITVLPGLEFLAANQQQQQTRQVFNILPRTSCSKNIPNESLSLSSPNENHNAENADPQTAANQEEEKPSQQDLSLYKINDALILPQELDIDANLQSQLIDLKKLEYSRPKKIADEYKYGWWNITDTSQLRQVAESMHERANRERNLKKHILKYFNNLAAKIRQNNVEFDITDLDRIISQKCPFGAPVQQSDDEWCEATALKLDIMVLELVEGLEETIASSSMQIRGWKPLARTEDEKEFILYPLYNTPKPDDLDIDEEKLKTLISNTANSEENTDEKVQDDESKNIYSQINNPILIARERLLAAEAGIERRYLKPPLGFKSNTILLTSGNDEYADNANDENATSGLIRWRDAVRTCESGTQLALLLQFLESCIAWDKSIMRASCQFCNSGENEAELLLCDLCDLGYHLYCFRPKMEAIPDGDWYCYECQNKNSIDKVCVICGKKGKLINCDTCSKVFHPNCLDPPISKPQKGRWFCFACLRKSKKSVKPTPSNSKSVKTNASSAANNDNKAADKNDKSATSNHQATNNKASAAKETKKKSAKKEKAAVVENNQDQSIDEKNVSTASAKETKKETKKKETKSSETKEKKGAKESKAKEKDKAENSKEKSSSKKKGNKELGTSILMEPKKSDNYNPSPFELLLEDIVQHKDSWPFLKPVDTTKYPLYKNIIKKPMDFAKIRQKNDAGQYTDPEQFLADCRLIFDNCETFNEDESPVVRAGRNLREFIEARWKELIE